MLVQVFLDALRFAQEKGRVLVGTLDELLENLHRVAEFLGKLGMFLVLPRVTQCAKARLEQRHPVLKFYVEPLQFLGEFPDLAGIHYGLWHVLFLSLLFAEGKLAEPRAGFQLNYAFLEILILLIIVILISDRTGLRER
jgi:hypothetical protein